MTKTSEIKIESLSSQLMEQLFSSNTYQDYKYLEKKLDAIRKEFQKRHTQESKRWELKDIVCVQQYYQNYDTNHIGLCEYLNDYGILPEVSYFDVNKNTPDYIMNAIKPFEQPITSYVKFSPRRGLTEEMKETFERYEDEALADLWLRTKNEFDDLEAVVEATKANILTCEEFQDNRKSACNYGSVSLIKNKPTFDMQAAYTELGAEFVIENAKVKMADLEKFTIKGIVTDKEVDKFRTVTSITSRYVVSTKATAQAQFELLNSKRMKQARNLAELWSRKRD